MPLCPLQSVKSRSSSFVAITPDSDAVAPPLCASCAKSRSAAVISGTGGLWTVSSCASISSPSCLIDLQSIWQNLYSPRSPGRRQAHAPTPVPLVHFILLKLAIQFHRSGCPVKGMAYLNGIVVNDAPTDAIHLRLL